MKVLVSLKTDTFDYQWEFNTTNFGEILPNVGDWIDLSFDSNGSPIDTTTKSIGSVEHINVPYEVRKKIVKPGENWYLAVDGTDPLL